MPRTVAVLFGLSILFQAMSSRRMSNILTYVRVALATSDLQSILEIPVTDEIHMEDRNYGLAWTMAYTTRNTVNRFARKEVYLNPVVPERWKEE